MGRLCSLLCLYLFTCHLNFADAKWFDSLNDLKPKVSAESQVLTVYGLLYRMLSENQAKQFNISIDPTLNTENETVVVDKGSSGNSINVVGTSGVAVSFGIASYLKNCCNIHISWDGNQMALPSILPQPQKRTVTTSVGLVRYASNVCTTSYSFVWWNWTRWEKHIDWMALNGINLPLAPVGREFILKKVFLTFGLTDQQIDDFFTGPAFLAWNEMGNLQRWAGRLSSNWYNSQVQLQKKILKRMLNFGMTPVLPAFAGHVPDAMQQLFPNASISALSGWSNFNCTYSCVNFVDPSDPLFLQIGSEYMNQLSSTFGLYHAYSSDPFNEMTPKSFDPSYITAVGQGIYNAMAAVDPKAIWVMQAWMFVGTWEWRLPSVVQALASSAPLGNLLFLDLYSEEKPIYSLVDSYHGQPFVWCMLHNFGGRLGLYGSAEQVNQGLQKAVLYRNSTLVGAGLTMEGINQNYPIYDMALDLFWSFNALPFDQIQWVRQMTARRYGKENNNVENAWQYLWSSVYNCTSHYTMECNAYFDQNPIITSRPSLGRTNTFWYNPTAVCKAWKYLVYESSSFLGSPLYKRDLVDVTRQILQMVAYGYYQNLTKAFIAKNLDNVQTYGTFLIQTLNDLDQLLASDDHFLLGAWIRDAQATASSDDERALFTFNAKNQVTLWGPSGQILDYARKQWAGLIKDYYKPRWELFVANLVNSLKTGVTFSQSKFNTEVLTKVEQPFGMSNASYVSCAVGDSFQIVKSLATQYASICRDTNVVNNV